MPFSNRNLRDPARLAALRRTQLIATGSNEVFDTLARLASEVLQVPIAVVSVIDNERQYLLGAAGIPLSVRENPPSDSFCMSVVASASALIVEDARHHPLAKSSDALEIFDIGSFLGVPVVTDAAQTLGALAAISHAPRHWSRRDITVMHDLATIARGELERRTAEFQSRSARAELAAERALGLRFQAKLLNTVQQAVIATDPEGTIIFWNGYAETLYGWLAEEALGNHISELLIGADGDSDWEEIRQKMSEGKPWTRERTLCRKDGSSFHALTTLSPMFDASGDQEGIVGVSVDLTSQKNLEEQIRQSQKMEAVGRLTGGIAHDFNNLLTVIRLNADLVLEQLHPSQQHAEDVKQIRDSANRAASLTKQLLSFSRKQILEPRPVHLNAIAADLTPILTRLLGEDIEIAVEANAEGCIIADSGQLDQVLVNLVVNARDAMPDGGRVVIRTDNVELDGSSIDGTTPEIPGSYIRLAVSDTGTGMTEETREKAFDAFFTTKPIGAGTGLGLSTVYGIVKQAAGYIHLYSEIGIGTTVSIYFPRVAEAAAAAIASSGHHQPANRGHEGVLIVEDDDRLRAVTRHILAARGYSVFEASGGVEAMRLATESPAEIDIVLTDICMPGMVGSDIPERMSAIRTGVRFLFMSGYSKDDLIKRGMLLPNAPFLQKPFTEEALANTIRDVLDSPETSLYELAMAESTAH